MREKASPAEASFPFPPGKYPVYRGRDASPVDGAAALHRRLNLFADTSILLRRKHSLVAGGGFSVTFSRERERKKHITLCVSRAPTRDTQAKGYGRLELPKGSSWAKGTPFTLSSHTERPLAHESLAYLSRTYIFSRRCCSSDIFSRAVEISTSARGSRRSRFEHLKFHSSKFIFARENN